MDRLFKILAIIIAVLAAIGMAISIATAIVYWNTPASEIPAWAWWIWRN